MNECTTSQPPCFNLFTVIQYTEIASRISAVSCFRGRAISSLGLLLGSPHKRERQQGVTYLTFDQSTNESLNKSVLEKVTMDRFIGSCNKSY